MVIKSHILNQKKTSKSEKCQNVIKKGSDNIFKKGIEYHFNETQPRHVI